MPELDADLEALDQQPADPNVLAVTSHMFFRLTGRVPEALVIKHDDDLRPSYSL